MTRLEKKIIEESYLWVPYCSGPCRHVSFIVKRNKIISVGINSYKRTHPLANKFAHLWNKVHSELASIVNFPRKNIDIATCDMYNVRVRTNGEVALSAPCKQCVKLIHAFNIRRVYYTNAVGSFERFI
jgi:deoxycytidylate deaminase